MPWGSNTRSAGVGYAVLSGVSSRIAQRGLHALGPLHTGNVGKGRGQGWTVFVSASGW